MTNGDKEKMNGTAKEEEDKEEEKQLMQEVGELHGKLVGRGIAVALELFREKGLLSKNMVFGRNKDQTMEKQLKSFGIESQDTDRVNIKYFDKEGKEISLKRAFREMCWKFHGKMPSHKKQEKLKLKEQALIKK